MAENVNGFLLYAADNGCTEDVEAALAAGADIDFDQLENWRPGDDASLPPCTPLFVASLRGHVDVVRLLLHKGASVAKKTMGAMVPLHEAASNGHTEIVEILVHHGATLDVRDGFKNTPLMAACGSNQVDTVRRLIELGARPDLTDGSIAQKLGIDDSAEDSFELVPEKRNSAEKSIKLLEEARKTKLLRCCNPKCGKPGYRSALKLCGRCKLTRYCSRDCQKQHWSVGHKKCCGQDKYVDEEPHPMQKVKAYLLQNDKQNTM